MTDTEVLLPQEIVHEVCQAAISASLSLDSIVSELSPEVRAGFQDTGSPSERLLRALGNLNRMRLTNGELPLRTVLRTAHALVPSRNEGLVFVAALAHLDGATSVQAPTAMAALAETWAQRAREGSRQRVVPPEGHDPEVARLLSAIRSARDELLTTQTRSADASRKVDAVLVGLGSVSMCISWYLCATNDRIWFTGALKCVAAMLCTAFTTLTLYRQRQTGTSRLARQLYSYPEALNVLISQLELGGDPAKIRCDYRRIKSDIHALIAECGARADSANVASEAPQQPQLRRVAKLFQNKIDSSAATRGNFDDVNHD